ncbi:MAG TPA: hypothetical protein VEM35_10705, partial [Rhizomicrobium sp.]|nr:hypothetical protein [Rhizomicrobium sp.]
SETIGTGIDTAALNQPGDEVALMAEPSQIGNDERWNRHALMHHLRHQQRSLNGKENEDISPADGPFCRFQHVARLAMDLGRCRSRRCGRA